MELGEWTKISVFSLDGICTYAAFSFDIGFLHGLVPAEHIVEIAHTRCAQYGGRDHGTVSCGAMQIKWTVFWEFIHALLQFTQRHIDRISHMLRGVFPILAYIHDQGLSFSFGSGEFLCLH
jgi:hypothetical protein